MTQPLWTAAIKDEVSATAAKMAVSLAALDKQADNLFAGSADDFKAFQKSLRGAGASALDASLIAARYKKELVAARKEALGMGKTGKDAWEEIQKAQRRANAEAEKNARDEERRARRLERIREKQARDAEKAWRGSATGKLYGAVSAKDTGVGAAAGSLLGYTAAGAGAVAAGAGLLTKDLATAVIDAAQFRQNALSGLEYMLGSREAAVQIFSDAQKLATETPLDTDKVLGGIKQLVTAGFSGDESKVLFKAVADQASKFADDAGMQEKVIAAFSRVKGRGSATGEDLESFRVAGFRAEGIIQALLDNEKLAPMFKKIKVPGIAGGKTRYASQDKASREQINTAVKEALGTGQIGTYTFLNAAIKSLETDKPNIGEFAKKMGKVSLTGTISNFQSSFGDLLKSTDVQSWEGVQAFQRFLTRITEAMSPASETGKRLLGIFENLINTLMGGLDNIKSGDIESFVERVASMAEVLVDMIKNAWTWFDKLLHSEPGSFLESIGEVLVDVGTFIGEGIYTGFKAAAFGGDADATGAKVRKQLAAGGYAHDKREQDLDATIKATQAKASALTQYADFLDGQMPAAATSSSSSMYGVGVQAAAGFEQGAVDALEIKSPSRTMARVGEMAAQGLINGTREGVAGAPAALSGRGEGGPLVQIGSINVGTGYGDAEAVGQAVARVIERETIALWQRKAREG